MTSTHTSFPLVSRDFGHDDTSPQNTVASPASVELYAAGTSSRSCVFRVMNGKNGEAEFFPVNTPPRLFSCSLHAEVTSLEASSGCPKATLMFTDPSRWYT